jgi:hypothetical protein
MASKARTLVPVALAASALLTMVVAEMASATHPRPKGASPLYVPFVPAYRACATPNRQHGPPLVFPSCNPPVQTSNSVTVGSPDANGAAANNIGFARLTVKVGVPGPPEDSDVLIESDATDIRCKAGTTACGDANTFDGPDYNGQMQGNAQIQITDHWNAVAPGGGPDAATVVPIGFPVAAQCVSTADPAIGGRCTINTSANAVVAGSVKDGKRGIVEIGQIQVTDGGPDGLNATAPNTLFGVQGIFIP